MDPLPLASNAPPHYDIYTGVWTDWSQNRVIGSTLTTTRAHGSLLIAFISLFVAIVGTGFWRICCFGLHCLYSTKASRDAIYHQRQTVLRNAANAATGVTSLYQVLNAWRRAYPNTSLRRILPLLIFSCTAWVAFGVASTFSSRLSTITGDAVLISSNNCGHMYATVNSNLTDLTEVYQRYLAQRSIFSAQYAEQYYHEGHTVEGCSALIKQHLSTAVTADALCPFPGDICKSRDANLVLDTGLIDSHYDLGSNAPVGQRYQIRLVLQAAPLKTEGYKQSDGPDSMTQDSYAQYHYGPRTNNGRTVANFTFQHERPKKKQYLSLNWTGPQPDMDINVYGAQYLNGSIRPLFSTMEPIKDLERTDADVYVAFLSLNTVLFPQKSDDLWYPAHDFAVNISAGTFGLDETTPAYWSDEVASPLGLALQLQVCKPSLPAEIRCTPLSSSMDAYESAMQLWPKSEWGEDWAWFFATVGGARELISTPIKALGSPALDSKSLLDQGIMSPLATNQWQLDVSKWFNISLATIQQNFVDVAMGPSDPRQESFLIRPRTHAEKNMCKNQKILSTAYINFPVFGLAAILIVGSLMIILSYTIEPLTVWIQRRRNLDVYARLEWTMNETFQLQRLAHEELGVGTWVRCDTDVPVTQKLERLGVLDLSDLTHPKLAAPRPAFEELLTEEGKAGERDSDQSETGSGESCARQKEAWAQVSAAAGAERSAYDSPGGGDSPAPSGVTQG